MAHLRTLVWTKTGQMRLSEDALIRVAASPAINRDSGPEKSEHPGKRQSGRSTAHITVLKLQPALALVEVTGQHHVIKHKRGLANSVIRRQHDLTMREGELPNPLTWRIDLSVSDMRLGRP